jgi:signal recognition particle GTPase
MVLQYLGEKIAAGLQLLANTKEIDDKFFRVFMEEITQALREADVNP